MNIFNYVYFSFFLSLFLYNISGVLIYDTCEDENYALEQALHLVMARSEPVYNIPALPPEICSVNISNASFPNPHWFRNGPVSSNIMKRVVGVVGASASAVTMQLASLFQLFEIPQVS